MLARRKSEIERLHRRLAARHPRAVIADSRAKLGPLEVRLARAEVEGLDEGPVPAGRALGRLHAMSPLAVLARGYAIATTDKGGRCVTRATSLSGKRSRFACIEVRFPPLSIGRCGRG